MTVIVLTLVPCVPVEAVTVLGAVEVLFVIVEVSCDFGGRDGGCESAWREAAEIELIFQINFSSEHTLSV